MIPDHELERLREIFEEIIHSQDVEKMNIPDGYIPTIADEGLGIIMKEGVRRAKEANPPATLELSPQV